MNVTDYYPGLLRHRVTIQKEPPPAVQDSAGGRPQDWDDVVTVWANVGPMSGRESVFAAQLDSVVSGRILMRYRTGLDAKMRALYRGRLMNIRAIINVEERDRWLVLFYDEGVET